MTTWIGVDPGMDGAIALYTPDLRGRALFIVDIPTIKAKTRRHVDAVLLHNWLADEIGCRTIEHVYIERAWAMRKKEGAGAQGVSSVFRYAHAYGLLHGMFIGFRLPLTFVAPASWKRALQVPADKALVRQRASELMPWAAPHWPMKKHHHRAEAAMIAWYGATRART